MKTGRTSLWRILAPLLAFALIAGACGDDDDDDAGADDTTTTAGEEDSSDTTAGEETDSSDMEEGDGEEGMMEYSSISEIDLSGIEIAVGSKDFTEQLVLGQLMVAAFEATGADVTDRVNLGGTAVAREALLSGDIDVYAEYNGTGWTNHLGQDDPSFDPDELTQNVREMDLAENDIHWLGQAPFNNTYGFATGSALTEENGGAFDMQGMADYLEANPDSTVCMETEFPDRPDGLVLFEDHTGYTIPEDQIQILDTSVIYTETADGNCDFGEIFTTDGRIPALDLTIVEDPGVMILYNISMNVRDDLYQQAPAEFDAIAEMLLAPLDNETMADLNAQRDVEGLTPEEVATNFLTEQGLIDG
ncbi:MAG: glycine betaine ABC transporter substrate-binding protein [Actinomycetota bacterium]|nr:glycine betaine ABC transporter substrate-binding protein [Actinomycetota bacterium]